MDERDIWRIADSIQKLYQDGAAGFAVDRARELQDAGDVVGAANWLRVVSAVNELRVLVPDGAVH